MPTNWLTHIVSPPIETVAVRVERHAGAAAAVTVTLPGPTPIEGVANVTQSVELTDVASVNDLAPEQRQILSRSIRFVFGSRSDTRMENWYRSRSLGERVVAECRSFEAAVALVGAGMGVCLAPALSCGSDGNRVSGIRLFATELAAERPLVAVFLEEHRQDPAVLALIEALRNVAARCRPVAIGAVPPILSAGVSPSGR